MTPPTLTVRTMLVMLQNIVREHGDQPTK